MKAKAYTPSDSGGDVYTVHYNSVQETTATAWDHEAIHDHNATMRNSYLADFKGELYNGSKNWFGGYSMDSMREALINPPACAAEVESLKTEVETDAITSRERRAIVRRQADGDEFDAAAWVRRDLDGWSRVTRKKVHGRLVRIAVNVACLCNRNREDLYYRGAAAVALSDILELSGYSVELTAVACSHKVKRNNFGRTYIQSITIKPADSPLDIASAALVCSEIGFWRGVMLPARMASLDGQIRDHLGCTRQLPNRFRQQYDIVLDDGIFSRADALAEVNKWANKFTC